MGREKCGDREGRARLCTLLRPSSFLSLACSKMVSEVSSRAIPNPVVMMLLRAVRSNRCSTLENYFLGASASASAQRRPRPCHAPLGRRLSIQACFVHLLARPRSIIAARSAASTYQINSPHCRSLRFRVVFRIGDRKALQRCIHLE